MHSWSTDSRQFQGYHSSVVYRRVVACLTWVCWWHYRGSICHRWDRRGLVDRTCPGSGALWILYHTNTLRWCGNTWPHSDSHSEGHTGVRMCRPDTLPGTWEQRGKKSSKQCFVYIIRYSERLCKEKEPVRITQAELVDYRVILI